MTGPEPPPRRSLLSGVFRSIGRICISRYLHAAAHLLWQGVKTLVAVLFILWTVGIPGVLLSDYLQPHVDPFQVNVSRITLNPLKGLIIRGTELYDNRLATGAVARVETCIIQPDVRELMRGRLAIRSIRWSGGSIILPQEVRTNEAASLHAPEFSGIQGQVQPRTEATLLTVDATSDLGAEYRIRGELRGDTTTSTKSEEKPGWTRHLERLLHNTYRTPRWIIFARERFSELQFSEPPVVDIRFIHDAALPGQPSGSFIYTAPAFTYLGQPFDGIDIAMTRSNGTVRIVEAVVRQSGTNRLNLTGSYHPTNRIFEAHLFSDLPTHATTPYLPRAWRDKANAWGLTLAGAMKSELWIGPCPVDEAPRSWGGWADIADAQLNDFAIERAFVSFKRTADRFILEDGRITGGRGIGRGEITFTLDTDYVARTSQGTCAFSSEMKQLEKVLPRGLRAVANYFDIEERAVTFNGRFHTPLDDLDRLVVTGDINGTNGAFRGVTVTGFNTTLVYSNDHVHLDPFHVTCPTGAVTGALRLDVKRDLYDIDLEITANPETVAPMGGTNLSRHFKPYHFTDDVLVKVRGLIDAKKDEKTALAVTLGGRGIGYAPFTFDRISAQAMRTPGLLAISNIVGSIYSGTVTGRVDVLLAKDADRFTANLLATNISLDQLVAALSSQPTNQYEGAVSLAVDITGKVPEPKGWPGVKGTGRLEIKDGRLLRIPIFGGLSTLLAKLYPGFGFSEQNLLEATLRFGGGAVHTEDLRLAGNVVSLSAEGRYKWTDELDFKVKVHPFRDGSVASVLRIVTMPISFILELELTGPISNPRWNAANLPL